MRTEVKRKGICVAQAKVVRANGSVEYFYSTVQGIPWWDLRLRVKAWAAIRALKQQEEPQQGGQE